MEYQDYAFLMRASSANQRLYLFSYNTLSPEKIPCAFFPLWKDVPDVLIEALEEDAFNGEQTITKEIIHNLKDSIRYHIVGDGVVLFGRKTEIFCISGPGLSHIHIPKPIGDYYSAFNTLHIGSAANVDANVYANFFNNYLNHSVDWNAEFDIWSHDDYMPKLVKWQAANGVSPLTPSAQTAAILGFHKPFSPNPSVMEVLSW